MSYMDVNLINKDYTPNTLQQKEPKTLDKMQLTFDAMVSQKMAEQEAPKSTELQLSKHATNRMAERGMEMSTELMMTLNEAVAKVRDKGARDAVMIGEEGAFIVNVPNNVVITAITKEELKDNVFTNIDSAILI